MQQAVSAERLRRYRAEPSVVAADVYWEPTHRGRGGWSWYTGSAGWLYRFGLESILGLRLQAGALRIEPCIPSHWHGYRVNWRHGQMSSEIACRCVDAPAAAGAVCIAAPTPTGKTPTVSATLDGAVLAKPVVPCATTASATQCACGCEGARMPRRKIETIQ